MPKTKRVKAPLVNITPQHFIGYSLDHLRTLGPAEPIVQIPEYMKEYRLSRGIQVKVWGKIVVVDDIEQGLTLVYRYPHLLHISNHGCKDTNNMHMNYNRL